MLAVVPAVRERCAGNEHDQQEQAATAADRPTGPGEEGSDEPARPDPEG